MCNMDKEINIHSGSLGFKSLAHNISFGEESVILFVSSQISFSLQQEVLEFADSAGDDGFIIFSLGTYVVNLKQDMNIMLAEAFSKLPQKVFWQLSSDVDVKLPPNVKPMKWLPQNDLLGRRKKFTKFPDDNYHFNIQLKLYHL